MKIPLKTVPIILAAGWLSAATGLAGSFVSDFTEWNGFTSSGDMFLETNHVILTTAQNDKAGSMTLYDLDGGQAIESFTATFKIQLGPGGPGPNDGADGLSFNFGPNIDLGASPYNEEGPGGGALTISFDTYDNGLSAETVSAPAVDIKFGGRVIAHHGYTKAEMLTGRLEDVSVQLTRAGVMTVSYKGQVIHNNVLIPGWAPTNGLFNFSARTGGQNEEAHIANLAIETVLVGTTVAPTITANPLSVTVNEGATTNFNVGVNGSAPFSFQWLKNNSPILDGTGASLTLGPIHYSDNNAKIKVTVTNPTSSVTSGEATVTVIRDTTAPTVANASANVTGTEVLVNYSEPVTDTALNAANYSIDQGISVSSVARLDATRVMLTTSTMPGGRAFVLTINNVQDTASSPPNTIANNTQVSFRSYLFQYGAVLHKKYNNMDDNSGYNVDNLFNDPRYPNFPDRQELMAMFEYPANGLWRDVNVEPDGAQYRNYYDTLEGYFVPPTTGDYVFYVTGADMNRFYLSTDADPANKHLLASVSGWTDPRNWNVAAGDANNPPYLRTNGLRSDYYTLNEWPGIGDPGTGSAYVHLVAGQMYYMLSVHHDFSWSGGDDFATTFTMAGAPVPPATAAPALTGNLVATYLDPTGASVAFVQQPVNATVLQGRKATFFAVATGQSAYGTNVTYQWQTAPSGSSTFTDLVGETKASYITPTLTLSDSGKQFRVLATVPGLTEVSTVASVTVNTDTIAPHLAAASALPSRTGATFDVGITFDEPVTQGSAETLGHYTLSAGTISAVKYLAGSPGVVLTVSGLAIGSTYNVTVAGVADPYGNAMSSSSMQLKVGGLHWGIVGGNEAALGNNVLALGTNAFDIYSDGVTEWAAYDESTFVYEQITGDFDKEVRVEYQDPSSQWARAGLIVRDVPNFGVNRAAQEGGQAGRYQKVHVNPVTTAMGTSGNNLWEGNRRLDTGAATIGTITGPNSNPKYPNAWCRIKRVGQTFTIFRSDDGINWVSLLATTWGVDDVSHTPMPNTVYVGPEFCPENGNVAAGLKASFVAKFRDYRTHTDIVPAPALSFQPTAGGMNISFEGTLQSADTLGGDWTDVTTISPYAVTANGPAKFYRAKR